MSDAVARFFAAWGTGDDAARLAEIEAVCDASAIYADPRTPEPLTGPAAIASYVGMFSANAPGWTAEVIKSDRQGDCTRATVAFGGQGPDGSVMIQHGQYFADETAGQITRLIGFVGTGAPE